MSEFVVPTGEEMVLRTPRLDLAPLSEDHADALFVHTSDPELPRMMTWKAHGSLAETQAFARASAVSRMKDQGYVWSILHGGVPGGIVGLNGVLRMPFAARFDRAELGYWMGRDLRGQGLMTEAARAVLGFAFTRLALHKVNVHAFAANAASLRVIEKLGFSKVGCKRRDVFRDGVWHDHMAFEMLEDDPAAVALVAERS